MLKRVLILCLAFALLVLAVPALGADAPAPSPEKEKPSSVPGYSMGDLEKLFERVTKTGVGFNTIPALYRPRFLSVSDASLSMDDNEAVFIVEYPDGLTRIYPQRIMVWHEVVNDTLPDRQTARAVVTGRVEQAGDQYTVSYSPLTGAVVAFKSLVGRYPSAFGVTGEVLNGNTVLFDWTTRSSWSQLLAVCVDGPMRGRRLERVPVLWATWEGAKMRYLGRAEVLSRSTGHSRPYGSDPYGSYQVPGTYYDDTRILHPLTWVDTRLPPKKRILGIEYEAMYGALQVDAVKEQRLVNFTLGIVPMVGLYDAELDAVRVFDRRLNGQDGAVVTFTLFEEAFTDQETRSEWNYLGECVYGKLRGKKLIPVYTVDAMWFAWAAFHRGTDIFPALPPAP